MPTYEYKVIPAPEKAPKLKGLKGPARFAQALEDVMNEMGKDGWHYVRADTLPHEERSGLTSRATTYRNLLVFQREILPAQEAAPAPKAAIVAPPLVVDTTTEAEENAPEPEPEIEEPEEELTREAELARALFPKR